MEWSEVCVIFQLASLLFVLAISALIVSGLLPPDLRMYSP